MMSRPCLWLWVAAVVACTQAPPQAPSDTCDLDDRPNPPLVFRPTDGVLVGVDQLGIEATPPAAHAGTHEATEVEIRRVRGNAVGELVWSAVLHPPATLTRASVAQGRFIEGEELEAWQSYGARMRYHFAGGCAGPWSPSKVFRIDDESSRWFDPSRIHRIDLKIPDESWSHIDAEAAPPDPPYCADTRRSYYPATLHYEDRTFERVGLRVKGCGSAQDLDGKPSFKVKLTWDDPAIQGCPVERRLYGKERLTLHSGVQDPSMIHETLGYAFHAALGLAAPRSSFVRLYVDGAYWGLYVNVESIDRSFLRRWFPNHRGMMYEGSYECDLSTDSLPYDDEDTGCFTREFKPSSCDEMKTDDDPLDYELLGELVAAVEALPRGGFYPQIETFFDFETFLWTWAADAVVGHWDAYEFWVTNNYRIYHDPTTGRWTLISTGMDEAFEQHLDPFGVGSVLTMRCREEPDCEAAFATHLHAATDLFEALALDAEAARLWNEIRPHAEEDPRRWYSFEAMEQEHERLRRWIRERPEMIREQLRRRGY